MTSLSISTNWKEEVYDSILVIVDQLIKMVYYKLVKITIDASKLAEIIMNVMIKHHNILDLIVFDSSPLFTPKFYSLLCYILGI